MDDRNDAARRIYEEWHRATLTKDLDALAALYATDAVFETPGAITSADADSGVMRGRDAIRAYLGRFFDKLGNDVGRWYRTSTWFTNGEQLIWEYPRETPEGEQPEILEVMDLDAEGLIASHRVYWGWYAVRTLFEPRRDR